MLRRIGPRRGFLLAALVLGTAACDDESPTLSGDRLFPGGAPPTTREVIVPAGAAFQRLGTFGGFTSPASNSVGFRLVANGFGGELTANTLLKTADAFPEELRYTQDSQNRTDTLFRAVSGTLVLRVDSLTSPRGPVTLRVFRLAQDFDANTATYDLASDSGGVRTPWVQRGGTRGELLSSAEYTLDAAGDSLLVPLDSAGLAVLRDTLGFGVLLDVATPGGRLQLSTAPVLRAGLRPSNAVRDTVVQTSVSFADQPSTFVFTPEPPQPANAIVAGGIRSVRTLFSLQLPDSVPGCSPPASCARVALRDVRLNRVSLLLRRAPVSPGFAPQDTALLAVYSISEPELGSRAPLGTPVLDASNDIFTQRGSLIVGQQVATVVPGDTVAELNVTSLALRTAAGDTVPTNFALLGGPGLGLSGHRLFDQFGLTAFLPEPRLRIVYTLPVRTELP